jgi:hypothetical protein
MTNLKISRKRIVQALGLVALGLALLVGSKDTGQALAGAAQEQQTPIFSVETTVNEKGGLEVELPVVIPGVLSVVLSVRSVLDTTKQPPALLPTGTLVSILGVAKAGVTQFSALEDLDYMMFFATVAEGNSVGQALEGSGLGERRLFARVTQFSGKAKGHSFFVSPEPGGIISMALVAVADFGCCETELKPIVIRNTKAQTWIVNFGTPENPSWWRYIEITFVITISVKCKTTGGTHCEANFDVSNILKHPKQNDGKGSYTTNPTDRWASSTGVPPYGCDGQTHTPDIVVTYVANWPSDRAVRGPLVIQFQAITSAGEVKGPGHLDELSADFDPVSGGTKDNKKEFPLKNPKITPK